MYIGKRYDGFAYSINTLMREAGHMEIPDPDCFSQRLILLSYDENSNECFSPLMHWNDYMPRLLRNIGISANHIFDKATEEIIDNIPVGTIFLLGASMLPEWDITITQKMCNEFKAFLVCKKQSNAILISNPLGYISMYCSLKKFMSLIVPNESFVFYFTGTESIFPVSKYTLLQEALVLMPKCNLIQEMKDKPPNLDSVRKKIAFHYGLIKYAQSRLRISEFFSLDESVKQAISLIRFGQDGEMVSLISNVENIFIEEMHRALRKSGNR